MLSAVFHSNFFLEWHGEEKDIPNREEEEESQSLSESEVVVSAPSAQAKDKKTADKGRVETACN